MRPSQGLVFQPTPGTEWSALCGFSKPSRCPARSLAEGGCLLVSCWGRGRGCFCSIATTRTPIGFSSSRFMTPGPRRHHAPRGVETWSPTPANSAQPASSGLSNAIVKSTDASIAIDGSAMGGGVGQPPENVVPKLLPDSSELSRTPSTGSRSLEQIRPVGCFPAEVLIRRSLVRIQPGASLRSQGGPILVSTLRLARARSNRDGSCAIST
jgi:hypothetical protein